MGFYPGTSSYMSGVLALNAKNIQFQLLFCVNIQQKIDLLQLAIFNIFSVQNTSCKKGCFASCNLMFFSCGTWLLAILDKNVCIGILKV